MTELMLEKLEKEKSAEFDRVFADRYSVELLELQGHSNPQGQCFADVDFFFSPRMTAEEIGCMCENVAEWLGGELHGTVNIDFSGRPSLSMAVEFPDE